MTRTRFTIQSDYDRNRMADFVRTLKAGMRVEIKQPKRTDPQNSKFWAMLGEIADQVKWHGLSLTEDDWKLIFMDALHREVRIVPNIDGNGFVNLSQSSSDLSIAEMSDGIELMLMFGANHGVKFKDSNSGDASDRPDTPAGTVPQTANPAGVTHSEASLLSDDWRDVYISNLAGVRDKAASLLTRHSEAIQMIGGTPNESELAWMRRAWKLVQKRNEGNLKRGEYDAELEKLKAMPLAAIAETTLPLL